MWNQTSIATTEQSLEGRDQMKSIKTQIRPPFAAELEAMDKKQIRKRNGVSFGLGFVFLVGLYLLVHNKQIRLSGPYMPFLLMLFHQRLEYVLRY